MKTEEMSFRKKYLKKLKKDRLKVVLKLGFG